MTRFFIYCFLYLQFTQSAYAGTWHIGPSQTYTKPSQVANLVQNGDTVLIDAGIYANDVARWTAHNLLFRGVGGLAHLKCGGTVYGGKAIWVIVGNDVTVENIEFSEAACPDRNGAGIRSEGINLTLRGCYFHDNENGILAGDIASGDFLIEHCEFSGNGFSDGLAHNLYINHAHSLTFRYNYSHDAKVGHELKSRAFNNFIYYNRFSDENGTASRNIDLPNGGFTILLGNIIVQDLHSENNNLVGYGLEGLSNPNSELYVVHNTFVNNKTVGSFLQVQNATPKLKVYNNILAGPGAMISGAATLLDTLSNLKAPVTAFLFADPASYNFHPDAASIAAGAASNAGTAGSYSLLPQEEYVHPLASTLRSTVTDAGAYQLPAASGLQDPATSKVVIYPNPARDRLFLADPDPATEVIILDTTGKIRLTSTGARPLDIHLLPGGMYLVKTMVNGHTSVTPFLKY